MGEREPQLMAQSEQPLRAFVSSVMTAATEEARATVVRVLTLPHFLAPWAFEYTPGGAVQVEADYLRHVREADFVIWLATRETTEPVRAEVREAISSDRRLWVVLLDEEHRDASTEDLLQEVGQRSKWITPSSFESLEDALYRTLADDLVRALRRIPGRSRAARLEELWQASRGRCITRWCVAGLPEQLARDLADDPTIGQCPVDVLPTADSRLSVLVGEPGSGKSLASERALQNAIARCQADSSAAIPAFLRARDLQDSLSESVNDIARDLGDPNVLGLFLVIDGVEEASSGTARTLIGEAHEYIESHPKARVLASTRSLPHHYALGSPKELRRLTEDDALSLVRRSAGASITRMDQHAWPVSLRESIRRPLFAIRVGAFIRRNPDHLPRSTADLLTSVTRPFLDDLPDDLEVLLRRLAVERIQRCGAAVEPADLGSPRQTRELCSTGLVVEGRTGLGFALSIFAEWFAARAIIEQEVSAAALPGPATDLWITPCAMAVASVGTSRSASILEPLARVYPAIASQVVEMAVARWGLQEDIAPPQPEEAARALHEAMSAWIEGLGRPLADRIAPVRADGRAQVCGATRHGMFLTTSWHGSPDKVGTGVRLSSEDLSDDSPHWPVRRSARPGNRSAWAWRWSLEELQNELAKCLSDRAFRPDDGPVFEECVWQDALALSDHGRRDDVISVPELRSRYAAIGHEGTLVTGGSTIDLADFGLRLARLEAEGRQELRSSYVGPDTLTGGGWIWSDFSPDRMLERTTQVFAAAMQAYGQIVRRWFPTFAHRLQMSVLMPVKVVGDLSPPTSPRDAPRVNPILS